MYKSRGFIFSYPNPIFKELRDHRVDVEVQLFEGDKFYLGRLEVQGNTMTRDKVIRREFALDEGDVIDMEAVKKSVTKIQQLGYFKMTEEPRFSPLPEDKKVDVVIKGQETSRNEIQFGAGYSGFDGFFGQFSFQTRNFLGRGEIIGASAQLGKVSNFFDLSYTVPWFMDRNQSVGAAIFRRNVDYLSQEERRLGGSLFYAKGLALFDSVSMLYAFEDITANFPVRSAPTPPGQPEPPQKFTETTGTTSSLTPAYRYDSRNDPFDPTRGFRLSASVQVAPSFLGGTSDFIKAIGGSTVYLPVRLPRGAILALNVEVGYVAALNQIDIPIFERFQLGGEQSLRGFQQGAAVPVDPDTYQVFTDPFGRILGGNKFFVLNVEYQFLHDRSGEAPGLLRRRPELLRHAEHRHRQRPGLGRGGAADLSADLPGPAALHLRLQPAPHHPGRPVRLPDLLPGGKAARGSPSPSGGRFERRTFGGPRRADGRGEVGRSP